MKVLHANRIGVTSLKMNERRHGALAMGRPVIDDFLFIEEDAGAAVGIHAKTVVAIHRRNEFAGPPHGKILRGKSGTW